MLQNDTCYTWNFKEFYLYFHNFCEIWHSFSQTPMRNSLWCYSLIILVQGFCPLKIKITQFPDGSCLKSLHLYNGPMGVEGQAEAVACVTGSWKGKEKGNKGMWKNTVHAQPLHLPALLNSPLPFSFSNACHTVHWQVSRPFPHRAVGIYMYHCVRRGFQAV